MLYGLVNVNGNFKAFMVLQNAKLWSTLHKQRQIPCICTACHADSFDLS